MANHNPTHLKTLRHAPWKPGDVPNPYGVKGKTGEIPAKVLISHAINRLVQRDPTREELQAFAKSKNARIQDTIAAVLLLRASEDPDIADYDDYLAGKKELKDLRLTGIDTRLVKKAKQVTRMIPQGEGKDPIEEKRREVEMHDRALQAMDRILDREEKGTVANDGVNITVNVVPLGEPARSFEPPPLPPPVDVEATETEPSIADALEYDEEPVEESGGDDESDPFAEDDD